MSTMLVAQLAALTNDVNNWVTNFANCAALLMQTEKKVDWAGFYLYRPLKNNLLLGPYQGALACNVIPNGKGVCGVAAQSKQTQLVSDVSKFPGHIACDTNSRSEIVVPLLVKGRLFGVMDLDSNQLKAFRSADRAILEKLTQVLVKNSNLVK